MRVLAVLLASLVLIVGTAAARPRCSASGMAPALPAERLTPAAARMRNAIAAAAVRCDYARLAALIRPGYEFFSFGGERDPAAYWRSREAAGEPVLRRLVLLLRLPARRAMLYVWPSAYREHPGAADWRQLARIYPARQIAAWRRADQYLGLRVGISRGGDWVYFIEGD